jgi:hypothetical protein
MIMPAKPKPIGVTLCNPLNMRPTQPPFEGTSGEQNGFTVFQSNVFGFRAAAKNIFRYVDLLGIKTVKGVISRWAPPEDSNDTEAYITAVCGRMGVDATTVLDFKSYENLYGLLHAMTVQEQSSFDLYFKPWELTEGLKRAGVADVPPTPLAKNMKVIGSGISTAVAVTGGIGAVVKDHAPDLTAALTSVSGTWPHLAALGGTVIAIASGLALFVAIRDHFRGTGT